MTWNKNIRQLIREAKFSLQRFDEDEEVDELACAIDLLSEVHDELVPDEEDEEAA